MCPNLGHILPVIIPHKRIGSVRLCGLISSPLLQVNRAVRYILCVTSQW